MQSKLLAIAGAAVVAVFCSSASYAQQKTITECENEWRANRAENQKNKITEKAYVEKCRADSAAAATPPVPPPATPPAKGPPATPPAKSATKAPSAAPTGAGQFSTEAAAKAKCPSDTVVWVNTKSKIYHFAGHKDYGTTKAGAYMCEADAKANSRAAKNEKHP